ncbi:MAG: PepSY domain-containing protein [Rudaea sp.]
MTHRTALIVALSLTVFMVVLVASVSLATTQKVVAMDVSTPTATNTATAAPTNTSLPTATKPKPTIPSLAILLADQAARIAQKLTGHGKLDKTPELVNFRGKMAYEILFDNGSVYVDAFSGKVLYNGINLRPTPVPVPTQAPVIVDNGGAGGGSSEGGSGGESHEEHGDDDHGDGGHED